MVSPDANERVVRAAMADRRFADVNWVASTGSTNTDLLTAAADPSVGERVLVTDHQSAGKGRRGRAWDAPPQAGLLVSVLVRGRSAADLHLVTAAMGLAAVDACREVASVEARLKWPNDLQADGRKLAGILAEASFADGEASTLGPGPASVVVGMGMNVNWADAMPAELAATAVALDQLAGLPIDRSQLLAAVLVNLERWLDESPAEVRAAHLRHSATVGQRVRVAQVGGEIVGDAVDIADDGRLVVASESGRQSISVGDVVHLRPAR